MSIIKTDQDYQDAIKRLLTQIKERHDSPGSLLSPDNQHRFIQIVLGQVIIITESEPHLRDWIEVFKSNVRPHWSVPTPSYDHPPHRCLPRVFGDPDRGRCRGWAVCGEGAQVVSKLLIVSDIHGCLKTLLALIEKHGKDRQLICLGDMIDRGPDSRGVVEYAMENHVPTCGGNHEDLAVAYSTHTARGFKAKCADEYDEDIWLANGGIQALQSWGADFEVGLPNKALQWMTNLPPYLRFGDLLLSHTGYGLDADKENWLRVLWGRHPDDGDFTHEKGKPVEDGLFRVFGHTRAKKPVVAANHVMIDTGCAYEGYGKLTGFLWPEKEIVQVENLDS